MCDVFFRYIMSNLHRKYHEKVVCLYCEENGSRKTVYYRKNLAEHTERIHGHDVTVKFRSQTSTLTNLFSRLAEKQANEAITNNDDELGPPDKVQKIVDVADGEVNDVAESSV